MWGTKAHLLEVSVCIPWAPVAVSSHSKAGPPTDPSAPIGSWPGIRPAGTCPFPCGQNTRNHLDNSVYDLASAAALAGMLPTLSCILNADVSGTGGGGKAYGLEAIAGIYNRV